MTRNLLVAPWFDPVCEWIHTIDLALSCRFGVAAQRLPLERARDQLNDLLSRLDGYFLSEDDDYLYVEFFDALSYLTESLRARPLNRSQLEQAAAILRRLRDERGAA